MNNLIMIENELVPVYETSTGEKVVYGTELHEVLQVKSKFADWVKNRLNDCEAAENEDFQSFSKILEKGGRPQTEYIIKLDTAKEMAMLERNEKGKQVRRYFIQIEKKYKQLENKAKSTQNSSLEIQLMQKMLDKLREQEVTISEAQSKSEHAVSAAQEATQKVNKMQQQLLSPIYDWRKDTCSKIRQISICSGIPPQSLYGEMYALLETRARCNLNAMVRNKRKRLELAGATEAQINTETRKIAVIEGNVRIKEIFTGIIREYAAKYVA